MSRYGTFWVDTADQDQTLFDSRLAGRVLGFTTGLRRWLVLALISAPVVSSIQLARPYILKLAVDDAITPGDADALLFYAGIFLAVLFFELVGMFGQLMLLQWIGQRVLLRMRAAIYHKVLKLDHNYHTSTPAGVTLTRVTNDLEAIQELFAAGIVTLVTDFLKLAGIMVIMLWINWRLAIVTFVVLPVLYVVSEFFRRRLRLAYRDVRNYIARVNAQLSLTVDSVEDIQAMGMEPDLGARFHEVNDGHRQANLSSILNDAVLYATVEMLSSVVIGALLWFGGGMYLGEAITLGVLIAFVEYVQMFFVPIRDLSAKYAVLQSAFASAEKVFGLLDTDPRVDEPDEPVRPERKGSAGVHNVSFGYKQDEPVLSDVNIQVPERRFIALVGPTGHGKSTVMRLLRRFYDPDQGQIDLDQTDVRDMPLDDVRLRTLAVEQKTFLFSGTVRENLVLTDQFDDEQLIGVLEIVGLANRAGQDLRRFLDQEVEEGGANLSMGERQLLSLARVLLREPDILVLDEATAHIDSDTEAAIYNVLRAQHGARTMIAVAHRLSTIREADEIILIRDGRIAERGTHDELIEQSGFYADLIQLHDLEAQGPS